jgi:hypothetical protein
MAYVHESGGWIPATGRQVKSCTTIDEDTLELFKSVIAENAQYYERTYVAALTKAWAEEIKAARMAEAMARHRYRQSPYRSRNINRRRMGLVY